MRVLSEFVHRCLAPFMAGASMAATTVVEEPASVAMLLSVAAICCFMSLPAGGRMIRRAVGNEPEA